MEIAIYFFCFMAGVGVGGFISFRKGVKDFYKAPPIEAAIKKLDEIINSSNPH